MVEEEGVFVDLLGGKSRVFSLHSALTMQESQSKVKVIVQR